MKTKAEREKALVQTINNSRPEDTPLSALTVAKEIEKDFLVVDQRQVDDHRCFAKALRNGEQTFTLRAQDVSAPLVVAEWIKQNIMTAPAEKLHQAIDEALVMRRYPSRKHAD